MKQKKYFLNIIEEGIFNQKFDGYRAGRIEVHKRGETYPIDEGRFLIPEHMIDWFRDKMDFMETNTPIMIKLDMFKYPDEKLKYYGK